MSPAVPISSFPELQKFSSISEIKMEQIDRSNSEIIGEGGQGKVFTAKYLKGNVAVKKVPRYGKSIQFLMRELKICDQIKHANIVQLMGVSFEPKFFEFK